MNKSEQKEFYYKIGREEGINETGLDRLWSIQDQLAEMGIISELRDEASMRLGFRNNKEFMNSVSPDEPINIEVIAAGIVASMMKGGELDGEGIGIQSFGRVQGSC